MLYHFLSAKNTKIELLVLREDLNNPDYKLTEFEGVKNEASANAFTMSPKKRIKRVNAVGIVSKSGRYGGIFTNSDNFHYHTVINGWLNNLIML